MALPSVPYLARRLPGASSRARNVFVGPEARAKQRHSWKNHFQLKRERMQGQGAG
jgi:hypothetical protein